MGMPLLCGLASGPACFVGLGSFLGLVSGPVSLIFRTLSKTFVQKAIDKYLEKIQNLCKDFTNSKMERIKNTIYKMVMKCLESSLSLFIKASPEKYI